MSIGISQSSPLGAWLGLSLALRAWLAYRLILGLYTLLNAHLLGCYFGSVSLSGGTQYARVSLAVHLENCRSYPLGNPISILKPNTWLASVHPPFIGGFDPSAFQFGALGTQSNPARLKPLANGWYHLGYRSLRN